MLSKLGRLSRSWDAGPTTAVPWARAAEHELPEPANAPVRIGPAPFASAPPRRELGGSIWWGCEQLLSCSPAGLHETCPAVIDVTGPARCLVFGPYLPLEPGVWRATAIFELCPEAARRSLIVEFGAMPSFTTKTVPRQPGPHRIEMEFEVGPDDLVEVRLLMTLAGFHGELKFSGALLERLSDPHAR